jgi:hypothetical protein
MISDMFSKIVRRWRCGLHEGRDKSAPGALIAGIAGIWGAMKVKLFGRSEEERRR